MEGKRSFNIINCKIFRNGIAEYDKTVQVRKGIVASIVDGQDEWIELTGEGSAVSAGSGSGGSSGEESGVGGSHSEYDAGGDWVIPGMVELHIHGCGDLSLERTSDEGGMLVKTCTALEEQGINTFVPTLQADPDAIFRLGKELSGSKRLQRRIPGLYIEGPFVHREKRGGILPEHIKEPDPDLLKRLQESAGGTIKLMTLAPELKGTDALLKVMDELGIIPCFGHSTASAARAREASGGRRIHLTHLFNAMSPLSHKEPGLAAVPFLNAEARFELNGDGVHVHPEMLKLCWRHLNRDNMVLISDAVVSAGKPSGEYSYFGKEVVSGNEGVRYKDNGVLIGSHLLIPQVARVFSGIVEADTADIIPLVTKKPLEALGIVNGGEIREGAPADIIQIDDEFRLIRNFNKFSGTEP